MSICYDLRGGTYVCRMSPKPRSAKWEVAREKRAKGRQAVQQQPRDKDGFIVKTGLDGGMYLYNPGDIDRQLWRDYAHVRDADQAARRSDG